MNMPVPAGDVQPPARPAAPARSAGPTVRANSASYTHRTWLDEMAVVLGKVASVYQDLKVMSATMAEIKAGRTQTALVADATVHAMEIMRTGVGFVDSTDTRYMDVFEAIQKAGGQDEVVQDKHYHSARD